jgi:hypothetical protein
MFVHFDSNKNACCDDCGNPSTVMHLCVRRSTRGLNLCVACLRALTLALVQAAEKLGTVPRTAESAAGKPSMVPA